MSSVMKHGVLASFGPAATQDAVEASQEAFPADYITGIIIEISGYLVSLIEQSTLFGRLSNDPYSPSLRTLHSRLHSGYLNPSPIQAHANEQKRIKAFLGQRTAKDAAHRPLEDFEDLYYAVLARMQDIHQILTARLGSGFNAITDLVYPDGPSIADLCNSLAQYWDVLNHTAFVKAIDSAVRRSRVKHLHQEILAQVHNDEITQTDADELLSDLYDPNEYDEMQGLAWVNGWAPSMVAAWLEEKYRIVLGLEKAEAESKTRMDRKRAKMSKKIRQPQHEVRSKKEGRRSFEGVQMSNTKVEVESAKKQLAQEQVLKRHQNQQSRQAEKEEQLQYAIDWQLKTQRVSEYTQYLRGMASRDAKCMVQGTTCNGNAQMSSSAGPVQHVDNMDTDMTDCEY